MEYKPMSTMLYTELNEKIESASEWSLFILVKVVFVGTVLPLLYVCGVNFYVYNLGEDSFYMPWPMLWVRSWQMSKTRSKMIWIEITVFVGYFCRLPFNWRTPLGYIITLAAEYTSINSAVFGFTPIISFFIGSGWFAIWIVKDITNDLSALKVKKASSNKQKRELKEKFCYIVRFYSDARELSVLHLVENGFNRR